MRALDLLQEAQVLRTVADAELSLEERRAVDMLEHECRQSAVAEIDGEKDAFVRSSTALVCSRGMTHPERADERKLLYTSDYISRHRQLVAGGVEESSLPVIMVDYQELVAVGLPLGFVRCKGNYFFQPHCIVLNNKFYAKIQEQANRNKSSSTLVHELVHAHQSIGAVKDEDAMEMIKLKHILCEGATECYARLLVRDEADELENDINRTEILFLNAAASAASNSDSERARAMIKEIALASDAERPQLAANLLTRDGGDVGMSALLRAAWSYSAAVDKETRKRPVSVSGLNYAFLSVTAERLVRSLHQ